MTIKPVYHDCYIFGLVIKKKILYYEEINRYAKALSIVFEMGNGGGGVCRLKKKTPYTPIFKTLIHGGEIVLE